MRFEKALVQCLTVERARKRADPLDTTSVFIFAFLLIAGGFLAIFASYTYRHDVIVMMTLALLSFMASVIGVMLVRFAVKVRGKRDLACADMLQNDMGLALLKDGEKLYSLGSLSVKHLGEMHRVAERQKDLYNLFADRRGIRKEDRIPFFS